MNIQVSWDNQDHKVIRYDYSRGWSWEDFRQAGKIALDMMNEASHTVHIIANFADGAFPPMGALGRFKTAQESLPKQSVVVVVGGGLFINALVSTFSRAYRGLGSNLLVANSLEDARAKVAHLLARSDPSR